MIKNQNGDTWSKRILLPDMGSDARHQARPISLAMVMKGRGSRSMRGSTSRKRETTTQYLEVETFFMESECRSESKSGVDMSGICGPGRESMISKRENAK